MADAIRIKRVSQAVVCVAMCLLCSASERLIAQEGGPGQRPAASASKAPTDIEPGSITYEGIPYPYPVSYLPLTLYGQDVRMAYMDVPPAGQPNGRTVVLLHGMNFG